MSTITLLHGSDHIIKKPILSLSKAHNDYGHGFYCTELLEMAKEWACKENKDGFVNEYKLNTDGLKILNLLDGTYSILNWIALLLKNRIFTLQDEIAIDARNYLIEHYLIDTTEYDIIIGYRADDSYFSYAQSFVSNGLSLRGLNQALYLGKLGVQTVLISEKSFQKLEFVKSITVDKETYYPKFLSRDLEARKSYQEEIKKGRSYRDDIFVIDILREEIKNDDSRIQRIIFK